MSASCPPRMSENNNAVPSRENAEGIALRGPSVNGRATPEPSAACQYTWLRPSASMAAEKANRLPSGNHTASQFAPGSDVSCLRVWRPRSTIQTSRPSSRIVTAMRVPSGDTRGLEYARGSTPTGCSRPCLSTHTSVRWLVVVSGTYANAPVCVNDICAARAGNSVSWAMFSTTVIGVPRTSRRSRSNAAAQRALPLRNTRCPLGR